MVVVVLLVLGDGGVLRQGSQGLESFGVAENVRGVVPAVHEDGQDVDGRDEADHRVALEVDEELFVRVVLGVELDAQQAEVLEELVVVELEELGHVTAHLLGGARVEEVVQVGRWVAVVGALKGSIFQIGTSNKLNWRG